MSRRIAVRASGDTPLVVAAALVRSGHSPGDAWQIVEQGRDKHVPDTDRQKDWLDSLQ